MLPTLIVGGASTCARRLSSPPSTWASYGSSSSPNGQYRGLQFEQRRLRYAERPSHAALPGRARIARMRNAHRMQQRMVWRSMRTQGIVSDAPQVWTIFNVEYRARPSKTDPERHMGINAVQIPTSKQSLCTKRFSIHLSCLSYHITEHYKQKRDAHE